MDTEETVSLGVSKHLDQTISVKVGLSTGVCAEREGSNPVGDVLVLQVLLALANPGNLGVCVHDGGNGGIVDVTVALLDVLDGSDSLLLSLVGQHRTEGNVTNGADVRVLGAVFGVNYDTAALIGLKTNVLKTEASGVRSATDSDEDGLGVELKS